MPRPDRSDIRYTTQWGVVRETGQIMDVDVPVRRGRKRKGRRKVYALMDLESLDRLELVGAEWEVLSRIMRAVNPETNIATIQQKIIAEDLHMASSNVNRIIRALRERRVLFDVVGGAFRVNAHIMYRGSNQDWDMATDIEEEPEWTR